MLDVTDLPAVRASIEKADPFDILVNNAGTNRPRTFLDVTEDDYDAITGLNLRAAYFVAQTVAKRLATAGKGDRSSISPPKWAMSAARTARSIA